VYTVDAGRIIGVDRAGRGTQIYTVVTDKLGNVITAHPGLADIRPAR
jgi:hypothetical protein